MLGIADIKIQDNLLNISDIILNKAAEICRKSELTKIQIRTVKKKGKYRCSIDNRREKIYKEK